MRITSKGQVTIPKHIRDQAGLLPNTEVEFDFVDGNIVLRKAHDTRSRGDRIVAHLKGRGHGRMSTDEIMQLTRDYASRK